MVVVRHPIRGFFAGLLLGLGLSLVLIQLAIAPLGEFTVLVLVVGFAVLGVLFAMLVPARGGPADGPPPAEAPPPATPPATPPPPDEG